MHDVFQKKLRDRALRREQNFRWCAHVSYTAPHVWMIIDMQESGEEVSEERIEGVG